MKCFFILCFSPGNTKIVLKVVNGFFHIHMDFIGGIPLLCTTDSSGISTKVLLWIDIDYAGYITDDRLVLDVKNGTITPLTRMIHLRKGTKEMLEQKYCISIDTEYYSFNNYERLRYMPSRVVQEERKITCAFLLERQENVSLSFERYSELESVNVYMENSISVEDLGSLERYTQLARKVKLYRMYYSSLEEVRSLLMENDFV